MFGPFGLSVAPYIQRSRSLNKIFKPLASFYAHASGHRQLGLKYDDLREHIYDLYFMRTSEI